MEFVSCVVPNDVKERRLLSSLAMKVMLGICFAYSTYEGDMEGNISSVTMQVPLEQQRAFSLLSRRQPQCEHLSN